MLVYSLSAWNIHVFPPNDDIRVARTAGGGGLTSADWRPARGSPTGMGGQVASGWPGAHNSEPKLKSPSTNATESRRGASQGLGCVRVGGKNQTNDRFGGHPDGLRRQVYEESRKRSGNYSDTLNHPCCRAHSATLPLCHSTSSILMR